MKKLILEKGDVIITEKPTFLPEYVIYYDIQDNNYIFLSPNDCRIMLFKRVEDNAEIEVETNIGADLTDSLYNILDKVAELRKDIRYLVFGDEPTIKIQYGEDDEQ